MYYEEGVFWLPCFVTIALILLSLLVLKKRGIQNPTVGTTGNTSSASASTSTSASGGEYEVFLSFRGLDTREVFTDFLYHDLVDAGIRTFKDDNELRVGEEIGPELLKAIKESKISIPIFSKNYASSEWCLRELAQMVVCQTTMGQQILPIFYDVKPSDVRHHTGSYEKAFRQHRKRCDKNTVQEWEDALSKVGKLKGWELEKETKGYHGELVKIVVSKVLLELKKNYMIVTDYLIGVDRHKQEMMRLLDVDSSNVCIVGILGMGGIGKTTIAKVIYNELSLHFQSCCFLEDVRERSQQHNGLLDLQNQLISAIRKRKSVNIAEVNEGANEARDICSRKKVFIVLDDVDDKSQFSKLVGEQFGLGSRIIVTTRNKGALDAIGVVKIYEPPCMESNHSLQLFSKHAFRTDSPPEDFYNLSEQIVSTAAGLPLTLEVIGSLLSSNRNKEEWEEKLVELKKIPDDKVQEKLKISYNALDYKQKKIFLDIACFFIGKDKTYPFYMWEDCEFYPRNGINILVLRSLVKVGDNDKLMMHDQLRDLGRQIVCNENPEDPGERSRLWVPEEAREVLERRMGTRKVEALCHFGSTSTSEEFAQLPNLRYLQLAYVDLDGDFKHLLSKLKWFDWVGCPGNVVPINFYLKNLIILNLSFSNIKYEWEIWSQIKMATKLKVLDLSSCSKLTKTPDLSTFVALERLILRQCEDLVEIHSSIGNLINLRVLDITYSSITQLPDCIGNLEKLEELDASGCLKLKGEIANIGRLSSLRILKLNNSKICSLPASICGLSCLQTLDLMWCRELLSLPELPLSLTSLRVQCKSMETLEGVTKLEILTLDGIKLRSCLNLQNFEKLSELKISSCHCLTEIQSLGKLQSLISLNVSRCVDLAKLDGLEQLENLRDLDISRCRSLSILPDLSNLTKLQSLDTSFCFSLTEIHGLDRLESLKTLDMSECISLESLPDLSNLKCLTVLNIRGLVGLTAIMGLEALESLEVLDISGCELIEDLPDLSNLKNLEKLKAFCCLLTEIRGLEELKSLKVLDISECYAIKKLQALPNTQIITNSKEARHWDENRSSVKKRGQQNPTVGTTGNTSSDSTLGGEYQVFLSYTRKDIMEGFIDSIYRQLCDAGIRTFMHLHEFCIAEEIGTDILRAIQESKICIPIFSKNYASSEWCLRELALMVECMRTMGHKILPIFYDVSRYDVMGPYRNALIRHQHFGEKTVKEWKDALREVGGLKGLELNEEANWFDKFRRVSMFVVNVLSELEKSDNLVGIDHHIDEMMRLLGVDSNDARIVGIHGMGGIGKTTIAKVVFNKLSPHFQTHCFLEDVRERSQPHKFVNLQNQLISALRKGKSINVADVNEGTNEARDICCRKKVFIVLDDVDHKSQFSKLVGEHFGSGSRIIVTTRDKEVLDAIGVVEIYEPPFMQSNHSLQLLSNHAFHMDSPPENFYNLSKQIVFTAAGLPLTLEVIGSLLYKKKKKIWVDTLMELKNKLSHEVREKLRISYDALEDEQKETFLNIVCFDIGFDKNCPSYKWSSCTRYKVIEILVQRSLVKFGNNDELMMHDQLRDLGRQIVHDMKIRKGPGNVVGGRHKLLTNFSRWKRNPSRSLT